MSKVIISGELVMKNLRKAVTKEPEDLALLDGFCDDDPLDQYFDCSERDTTAKGGFIFCRYDATNNKLLMMTEYDVDRDLTESELQVLLAYTRGQWSDGRGEFCLDDFSVSGFSIETCIAPSLCSVQQADGEALKPAGGKGNKKSLIPKWKKAADKSKPKGQSKALIDCLKALDAGDWDKAEQLLPNVNAGEISRCSGKFSFLDGWNILSFLVFKNRPDLVARAIDLGADVNFRTEDNQKGPIHWVRSVEVLDILVNAGADVKMLSSLGKTALHFASSSGFVEVVKRLLDLGLDVDARDSGKMTPLMGAARNGKVETVKLLLESGADANARDSVYSVLTYATEDGPRYGLITDDQQVAISKLLKDAGGERWSHQ
jgi:hypothetical protein